MLAAATTPNTSFVSTYDRSGRTLSRSRSEPVPLIAVIHELCNIILENYEDKFTLSGSGAEKSRQTEDTNTEENSSAGTTETEVEQQETVKGQLTASVQEQRRSRNESQTTAEEPMENDAATNDLTRRTQLLDIVA